MSGSDGSWGLLRSGGDLSHVDPLSGTLLSGGPSGRGGSDATVVADLIGDGAMAVDTSEVAEKARADAEARRRAEAEARARAAGAQTSVGPDGCPSDAPPGTLRDGADSEPLFDLCAASVAAARTAEAAGAVKFALSQLGKPSSQPDRMADNAFDCSSLVGRAFEAGGAPVVSKAGAGQAPLTGDLVSAPWVSVVDPSDVRPGDLVFPPGGCVEMVLADGFSVGVSRTGDVVHVGSAPDGGQVFAVVPDRI